MIILRFIVSSLLVVVSCKGFHLNILFFSLISYFHYYVIDFNKHNESVENLHT